MKVIVRYIHKPQRTSDRAVNYYCFFMLLFTPLQGEGLS